MGGVNNHAPCGIAVRSVLASSRGCGIRQFACVCVYECMCVYVCKLPHGGSVVSKFGPGPQIKAGGRDRPSGLLVDGEFGDYLGGHVAAGADAVAGRLGEAEHVPGVVFEYELVVLVVRDYTDSDAAEV